MVLLTENQQRGNTTEYSSIFYLSNAHILRNSLSIKFAIYANSLQVYS